MKDIIENSPVFQEAYDANSAHSYFNQVKQLLTTQKHSIPSIDEQAKTFGPQAVAFRTMLKFIESEQAFYQNWPETSPIPTGPSKHLKVVPWKRSFP